jgi:hypothetical protein
MTFWDHKPTRKTAFGQSARTLKRGINKIKKYLQAEKGRI